MYEGLRRRKDAALGSNVYRVPVERAFGQGWSAIRTQVLGTESKMAAVVPTGTGFSAFGGRSLNVLDNNSKFVQTELTYSCQ